MAIHLPDLRHDNVSLYLVPVFWAISVAPRFWSSTAYQTKTKEKWDSRAPRDFVKAIEDNRVLDVAAKGRLRRAEAAVANSFENFGPFAAAVAAGSAAKLDPAVLNFLSIAYLLTRIAFIYLYIHTAHTYARFDPTSTIQHDWWAWHGHSIVAPRSPAMHMTMRMHSRGGP
ncbi:uncharacterized protein MYCGRDRAFT_90458 [Zymoseptoria tritici IPO323]|uniref:Uncharacterized protein n=1 Tax=Zymoseptoria tritici (strain CBS 115943 / IPO323) TaxID=336722 RepID=F9X439_ZYMTI|nr:uncharacterized protein MYCGRDRAFT_90458 [Zymoseptoria tritici IPO323]EGP90722.1 hypothetical protein MYCGRDRAFT_90458 [Zymoseptoria tritici IPO323]